MKRPALPTMALAPTCGRHDPTGTAAYCPACAMARIDRDRALNPAPRVTYRSKRSPLLIAATLAAAVAISIGLNAVIFIMQGAPSWHH